MAVQSSAAAASRPATRVPGKLSQLPGVNSISKYLIIDYLVFENRTSLHWAALTSAPRPARGDGDATTWRPRVPRMALVRLRCEELTWSRRTDADAVDRKVYE
jgi:hypothetical protein